MFKHLGERVWGALEAKWSVYKVKIVKPMEALQTGPKTDKYPPS
jgi:hypothetical protein